MKKLVVVAAVAAVVGLTGCGHNMAVASKGVGARIAWTPDTIMPELNLGYFEVGSALVRENATFKYQSDSLASLNSATEKELTSGNIGTTMSLTTKEQVNGYTVAQGQTEVTNE